MDVAHFDRFFLLAAAGLGLLLAGGLNFSLGRKGQRVWLRGSATVVVCGAVLAGLALTTRAELAIRTACVLVPILLLGFLAGSEWFARQMVSLVSFLRLPGVRWGLVSLVGIVAITAGGVSFDLADEAVVDQAMKDLDIESGRPPTRPAEGPNATTDRGTQVVLKETVTLRDVNELKEAEAKALRAGNKFEQVLRRTDPSDISNCHGWVFTGGKHLLSPDDVELILKENGYQEVYDPRPGDLVVYRQDRAIAHTAIVRYVTEGQPVIVEGKWGAMGVFQHHADQSSYGAAYTFHRSARPGHLLVGVGGIPNPKPVAVPPVASE